jgi:hypothetical protein
MKLVHFEVWYSHQKLFSAYLGLLWSQHEYTRDYSAVSADTSIVGKQWRRSALDAKNSLDRNKLYENDERAKQKLSESLSQE